MRKNMFTKALSLLLALSLMLSVAAVIPGKAAAEGETSGKCGENITWEFAKATGVLTLAGTGKMIDFENPEDIPWAEFVDLIKRVVIKEGIQSVGKNAFAGCTALEKVSLPASIQTVDAQAFAGAEKLALVTVVGDQAKADQVMQGVELPEGAKVVPVKETTTLGGGSDSEESLTTKTYTTESGATVTETWQGDNLIQVVWDYGNGNKAVETGFVNNKVPTKVEWYDNGTLAFVSKLEVDAEGNPIKETQTPVNGSGYSVHYYSGEKAGWTEFYNSDGFESAYKEDWLEDGTFIQTTVNADDSYSFTHFTKDYDFLDAEQYDANDNLIYYLVGRPFTPDGGDGYSYRYTFNETTGAWEEHYQGSGIYDVENGGTKGEAPANAPTKPMPSPSVEAIEIA